MPLAKKWHVPVREYIDQYWKPLASIVLLILFALATLEKAGFLPTSDFGGGESIKTFLFIGCLLILWIVIHSPLLAYWIHRFLFGKHESPPDPPRIFRGPEPFGPNDEGRLIGRKADIEECLRRIAANPWFVLEGESGCGKSSLLESSLLPTLKNVYEVVSCRVAIDPFGKLANAIRGETYKTRNKPVGSNAFVMAVNEKTKDHESAVEGDQRKPTLL